MSTKQDKMHAASMDLGKILRVGDDLFMLVYVNTGKQRYTLEHVGKAVDETAEPQPATA